MTTKILPMTQIKRFSVQLTIDEINVLLNGLGELPAKQSYWLITRLREAASSLSVSAREMPPRDVIAPEDLSKAAAGGELDSELSTG